MAHLTRTVLVLGSIFGSLVVAPAHSQAGVIPWVYDAIFGPVGSMRGGYVPTYASAGYRNYGYGYGGYGVGYGSYSAAYTSYAPTTVAYAPSYAGYGSSCGCSQSASYAPVNSYYSGSSYPVSNYSGASNCNNCASGNCSSTSAGYPSTIAPTPSHESSTSSSDLLHRLEKLEHDTNQLINFLKKQHSDDFSPSPYTGRNSTYKGTSGGTETVRPRDQKKHNTFESDRLENDNYPLPRRTAPGSGIDDQENRKPEINPPSSTTDAPANSGTGESVKPSTEEEPRALRLDSRITTRAVAPRDRIQLSATPKKLNVAKSETNIPKKATRFLLESSLSAEVARH